MAEFTTITKNKLRWQSPPPTVLGDSVKYLNIGSGYNLLIATGHKLIIQPGGRQDIVWTTRNKYS
jgi:hypothetical protein